jgi:hypothetical protein
MGLLDFLDSLFGNEPDRTVDKVVRTLHSKDGKRRLGVFHRADGSFIFQEDAFNDRFDVSAWEPVQAGPDEKGCATPEDALAAARQKIPWLWEIPE